MIAVTSLATNINLCRERAHYLLIGLLHSSGLFNTVHSVASRRTLSHCLLWCTELIYLETESPLQAVLFYSKKNSNKQCSTRIVQIHRKKKHEDSFKGG